MLHKHEQPGVEGPHECPAGPAVGGGEGEEKLDLAKLDIWGPKHHKVVFEMQGNQVTKSGSVLSSSNSGVDVGG